MSIYYMSNELQHHGIMGMKWGIRRYQNKDGSLTAAGKKRVQKLDKERRELTGRTTPFARKVSSLDPPVQKKKSMDEMSDAELNDALKRKRTELDYSRTVSELNRLNPTPVSKGKKFIDGVSEVVAPAVKEAAKDSLTKFLKKTLSDALGVSEKDLENTSAALEKEAKDWANKVKIDRNKQYFKDKKAAEEANAKEQKDAAEAKKRSDQAKVDDINEAAEKSYKDNKKTNENGDHKTGTKGMRWGHRETSDDDSKVYEGEVVGEGTSKRQKAEREKTKQAYETIYDVPFDDISDSSVSAGRDYVSSYSSSNTSLSALNSPSNSGLLTAGQNYIELYVPRK